MGVVARRGGLERGEGGDVGRVRSTRAIHGKREERLIPEYDQSCRPWSCHGPRGTRLLTINDLLTQLTR